jgi:hypothetical protein
MPRIHTTTGLLASILLTASAAMASPSPSSPEDGPFLDKRVESYDTLNMQRKAHGIIMSICFAILFPLFAMSLYLVPYSKVVSRIHAPLQIFTLCLAIVGFGLGVNVEVNFDLQSQYHPKIGITVMVCLIVVQPLAGYLQHRYFKKNGGTSIFGHVHRWFGRAILLLGMINGGLGLKLARDFAGDLGATRGEEIAYGVVAGVFGLSWFAAAILKKLIFRGRTGDRVNFESADEMIEARS